MSNTRQPARHMTGSRFVAEAMQAYGVSHVFIVPTILTPALAEMEGMGITRVTAHCEKAAAYMADGYARVSHRPGICGAQAIGASNLAAGLRDPYMACSPVIALAAGRSPESKYRYLYQEIDDTPLYAAVTKFSAQVDCPQRLPDLLRQAFREAVTGCPGPVHLEIAGNCGQGIEGEADLDGVFEPQFGRYPAFRPAAEVEHVQQALDALESASRPVIVAGGGVAASGAAAEVVALGEKLAIPVATSMNAKGTIAENHRLAVGVVGSYSRVCANRTVAEADLVFFIGSRTGGQVTNSWRLPRPGTQIIQLDIAPQALGRNLPNVASLCGDARTVLRQMIEAASPKPGDGEWTRRAAALVAEWRAEAEPLRNSSAVPIRPERICREVQDMLPEDAILVSDTGHSGMWSGMHIEIRHPAQRYIRAAGSLGWALPAAIGAKCAEPARPVVCFCGDGAFYYHFAELETALRYGINVVVVINDNHAFSQETDFFNRAYGGRQTTGFEMWKFGDVNLAAVAQAMGCHGERVEQPDGIRPALERAIACGAPAVVDVVSDVEILAPLAWD